MPETRQGGRLLAVLPQQGKRVGEIRVKQGVMLNHGKRAGVRAQRRTLLAEHPPARSNLFCKVQCSGGAQQPSRGGAAQCGRPGDIVGTARSSIEQVEQVDLDRG